MPPPIPYWAIWMSGLGALVVFWFLYRIWGGCVRFGKAYSARRRWKDAAFGARHAVLLASQDGLRALNLKRVELDVKRRKIQLLYPLEFKGAHDDKQAMDSHAVQEAVFADPELADEIINEVAKAINLVNNLLASQHLHPFSILIGGHTSADTKGSERASLSRAVAAAALLAEHLAELAPRQYKGTAQQIREDGKEGRKIEAEAPNGSAIRARGFGASQRLPGFDDGKNYEQNRRVEVKLTL